MSRVLVTGASGLLGRSVAQALIARGDDVTVTQRRASGLRCREVLGDIADPAHCAHAVAGQDAVIHLAAKVDVVGRWSEFRRANVTGTENLLQAGQDAGVGRFVHISSPSVAHSGTALVGAAAQPADPRTARGHYARSKAIAEQAALGSNSPSFAVTALRPHLVWGPGDTQLIARVVARARAGRLVLVGSGAALIDTVYVTNARDAIVAGLDRCADVAGQALVVTNGEPRPIAEILARVCAAAGMQRQPHRVPYPLAWTAGCAVDAVWVVRQLLATPGEPPVTRFLVNQLGTAHWFAQNRTRHLLQWTPLVSLDDGFAALTRWYACQQ